jgi:hypothetical protein
MNTATKKTKLQRLLDQSSKITVRDCEDPTFTTWKNTVERTLISVFGSGSPELKQFKKLPQIWFKRSVGPQKLQDNFERNFEILIRSIKTYIEEHSCPK